MSFRWKLFIAYIFLLVPALLVFYIWTERWLRSTYLEVVRDQLEREVRILATVLDLDSAKLDEQVDEAVEGVGRRLTVIAADGRVIADSSFSGSDLAAMAKPCHPTRDRGRSPAGRRQQPALQQQCRATVPVRCPRDTGTGRFDSCVHQRRGN